MTDIRLCLCPELPGHQQLSGDPGLSVREGGGEEVLEESLHVPAALGTLLLDEGNFKGSYTFPAPLTFLSLLITLIIHHLRARIHDVSIPF